VVQFAVTSHREEGRLVVVPTGELDIASADAVRSEADRRNPDDELVLDLRGLTFVDTSGIQLLVELQRAARDEGFALRIVRARAQVHRVFEIAGLEEVLPFAGEDERG
jgi:anti-sigma B factor antagonist